MRQSGVESIAETNAERESRRDETQRGSACRHRRTVHRGLGGPGPPQFLKNLQTGPLSFLKICRRAPPVLKKNYFHRTLMPAGTKAERRQRQKQNPGRDETRLKRETQSERETTSNDSLKHELVRRALLYRESATAFVVLHLERDLHEHANGCRKRRTSSGSCAAHSSSSRARLHKARTCNNISDIIDWRYFDWRYIAGDIIYWRYY